MRPHLVAKLSGGVYLYQENDYVRRVLRANQGNYPKDMRVMRVTEMSVDLSKPLAVPPSEPVLPNGGLRDADVAGP
jgi:hypothetical protein